MAWNKPADDPLIVIVIVFAEVEEGVAIVAVDADVLAQLDLEADRLRASRTRWC